MPSRNSHIFDTHLPPFLISNIWRFPKKGGTSYQSSMIFGVSSINHPASLALRHGFPPFWVLSPLEDQDAWRTSGWPLAPAAALRLDRTLPGAAAWQRKGGFNQRTWWFNQETCGFHEILEASLTKYWSITSFPIKMGGDVEVYRIPHFQTDCRDTYILASIYIYIYI